MKMYIEILWDISDSIIKAKNIKIDDITFHIFYNIMKNINLSHVKPTYNVMEISNTPSSSLYLFHVIIHNKQYFSYQNSEKQT